MGVTLTLSGSKHPTSNRSIRLCGNRGFDQVEKWAATLPKGKYPAVDAFFRDHSYQPTDELESQMNDAALAHDPPADGTDQMVYLLLNRVGPGFPDETVAVTFGD